jgi:hypothetical protein
MDPRFELRSVYQGVDWKASRHIVGDLALQCGCPTGAGEPELGPQL